MCMSGGLGLRGEGGRSVESLRLVITCVEERRASRGVEIPLTHRSNDVVVVIS